MQNIVRAARERKLAKGEEGFTLIELLIVIVVLGILAAVVVISVVGLTGKSALAACQSDAKSVESALAAYNAQNSPGIVGPLNETEQLGTSNDYIYTDVRDKLVASDTNTTGYLKSWPHNPDHYFIGVDSNTAQVVVYAGGTLVKNAIPFEPSTPGGQDGCQQTPGLK
jgi:general secretion pathway protein G